MKKRFVAALLSATLLLGGCDFVQTVKVEPETRYAIGTGETYLPDWIVKICEKVGKALGISPEFLEALIEEESSGDPKARNGSCCGLCQLDEDLFAERMKKHGVSDIFDPYWNVYMAAEFFIECVENYGDDFAKICMIYNGTRGAKDKALAGDFTDYANDLSSRTWELEEIHGKHDYKKKGKG